ncbi:hypothetical protein GCM10020001_030050 [Nonomuraea salmonea]
MRFLDWMEVAEHHRYRPCSSRKKTLPIVLGRLTFLLVVALLVVVGPVMPGLPSGTVLLCAETSFGTSLVSRVYCVALRSAAPLASSQKKASPYASAGFGVRFSEAQLGWAEAGAASTAALRPALTRGDEQALQRGLHCCQKKGVKTLSTHQSLW